MGTIIYICDSYNGLTKGIKYIIFYSCSYSVHYILYCTFDCSTCRANILLGFGVYYEHNKTSPLVWSVTKPASGKTCYCLSYPHPYHNKDRAIGRRSIFLSLSLSLSTPRLEGSTHDGPTEE